MNRVLPVLFFLLSVGIFFTYVRPTYAGPIAQLRTSIENDDAALAAAAKYDERQAELSAQRSALSPADLERLQTFLPDGVDNVRLILDLNALAARSGVSLSGFAINGDLAAASAAPLDGRDPIDSIDLSLVATGTYEAFQTFLTASEASLRPLDLMNLEVKASPTGVYSYTMTFRIYWLR